MTVQDTTAHIAAPTLFMHSDYGQQWVQEFEAYVT